MVARGDSMFGCYDSYSYRLWSLANVWNTCHFPALTNGTTAISAVPVLIKDDEDTTSSSATTAASVAAVAAISPNPDYCLKCPQCGKSCGGSFHALKEHLALVHPDLGVPDQQQSSGLPPPLGPGALSPTGLLGNGPGGPYGCSQCTSAFANKDQLEKHELLHSPNSQVSCKICNKTFANVYRLQRHMISHDESAILRKFKCTECDKAFKFKHHLKEHIRIHSGEKPFECGNCGKRFSHSGSYSSHMTSKKCLVMNLKLGRTRTPATTNSLTMENKPPQGQRGPKRASPSNVNSLNNNITTTNHNNSYLSILPKYPEAAAAAFLHNSLATNGSVHPFYMSPASIPRYPMPTLEHILDQLKHSASPLHPPSMPEPAQIPNIDKFEDIKRIPIRQDDRDSFHPPAQNLNKSRSSSYNDLIMDEQSDHDEKIAVNDDKTNGDLQAVKMILETVNATVTQQLLQANMHKFQDRLIAPSPHSSARSTHSPITTNHICRICKRIFGGPEALEDHDCELNEIQSEGLAAKLVDAVTTSKNDQDQINGNHGGNTSSVDEDQEMDKRDDYDLDSECVTTTDQLTEDGRKVRVRSLISDEQLKILKDNYTLNQRPKREELLKIADQIGFPVRVVQVWFQNTRARDRREGRIIQVPYSTPVNHQTSPHQSQLLQQQIVRFPITPQYLHSSHKLYNVPIKTASSSEEEFICEQPLDLSTRNKDSPSRDSSPSSSPRRSTSVHHHSDSGDDVMNLSSHKSSSSRSPTPVTKYHHNHYHHHQVSNSSSSDTARRTPSPMDYNNGRLAQILAQQQPKLAASIGLVPMEHLMQFSATSDFPSISQLISNRMSANLSPGSSEDKRSIIGGDGDSQDDDAMSTSAPKRRKMSGGPHGLVVKSSGLGSPIVLPGSQEIEAEGQFTCDQCDKAFNKQSSLARHKYEHSGQRPHKCNECTKAFKHKHHLTEHKRLHSGEKPFQCSKCLKRFSHSGSYSQHMNHRYSYCKPYRE